MKRTSFQRSAWGLCCLALCFLYSYEDDTTPNAYADDTTPNVYADDITPNMSCFIINNDNLPVNIGTAQMQISSSEKLLGTKIDSKLNFKHSIGSIYKKRECQIKCFDQSLRLHGS